MRSPSIGMDVNVQIREIDRTTGLITKSIVGHNKITRTGLKILADYISAYFDSSSILSLSESDINLNKDEIIRKFKTLVSDLPYCIHIGKEAKTLESYDDTDVLDKICDPKTGQPITFKLSDGSSTLQSALIGSLQSVGVDGYSDSITISYTMLSRSDTFENFKTNSSGVIIDENNENKPMKITELSLMNYDETKCWARISLRTSEDQPDDEVGLFLNKNRIYDILWNINLVSLKTQLKSINQ